MLKLTLSSICTVIIYLGCAQSYHKAKIFANSNDLRQLGESGVCVDHGIIKKEHFIISDFSEAEIDIAKRKGLSVEILIRDVVSYYQNQNDHPNRSANRSSCSSSISYNTPLNFSYGSMAGYFTYQEFLNHLDSMASKYPNLVKYRQPIDTFKTHENRDIYWVKISDNPNIDENEPEVFYSSIHHAREVASLSQLIYYMWYILENYNSDQNIKNLVDHTEMFFVPMINPDGYIENQTSNPSGGGMWRKNKKNNGAGIYGVDLNRNYGYQWGGPGASTNPTSDTYRGDSAFSEPETQAIKWFCEQHQFKMALNAHTFSNLLLYPYGYANNVPTPEDNIFKAFSAIMVRENGYDDIIGSELYPASGVSDDWFYGEQSTKSKIYAMTPEIGSSFWPAQANIIPLCNENIFMNIMNAKLASRYALIEDKGTNFLTTLNEQFVYNIKRLGLDGNGDFTVSLTPISSNISAIGLSDAFSSMSLLQQLTDSISLTLSPTINVGDKIIFTINIDNGLYTEIDTIEKVYGLGSLVYSTNGSSTNGWNTTGYWATTTSDYVSTPSSITDSPNGNYGNQITTTISSSGPITIPNGSAAFLNFWMKCDIEAGWDYAQVEISTDGINYTPLCGLYTKDGNGNQATGEPVYDNTFGWVQESIDITPYLNTNVLLRFKLVTDQAVVGDGFYFDDLEIRVLSQSSVIEKNSLNNITIYPNPTNNVINLKGDQLIGSKVTLLTLDGKAISSKISISNKSSFNLSSLSNGVYFIQVENNSQIITKRFLLNR